MSTEVATTQSQEEAIATRREGWGKIGVGIYLGGLDLQVKAQDLILKIKYPTRVEELPNAEALLKEIKAGQNSVITDRKQLTGKLDAVVTKLMDPEKSLNDPIANLSNAIIKLKQDYEKIQQVKVQKELEIKTIKERIKEFLATKDFEFRSDISTKITLAYEYALTNDIKPEALATYLDKVRTRVGVMDFTCEKPDFKLKLVDVTEMDLIMQDTFLLNPHAYVSIFQKALAEKFSDYEVAYKKKAEALELSRKAEEDKQAQLKKDLEEKELANKLEATATPLMEVGPEVKALKKVYEVNMPNTYENMRAVIGAFFGNEVQCKAKLKVKEWFSFTPAQMASALAKVKNDDNSFEPKGIIWKEVSKL